MLASAAALSLPLRGAEADQPTFLQNGRKWVETAEALTPELSRTEKRPRTSVVAERAETTFFGWRMKPGEPAAAIEQKAWKAGQGFVLDFGEHMAGYLKMRIDAVGRHVDAPLRFKVTFGEAPAEVAEPFDPYPGTLSRSWLQDEIFTVDVLPAEMSLPRRYAFRYVKIEVIGASGSFRARFSNIRAEAVTSARGTPPPLSANTPEMLRRIDTVGLATLRDCMQTVFEDGPKRDRRLWLGDLRLQALANYVSFREYKLVKRCLYLFAGLARKDGIVLASLFERPSPKPSANTIMDYAALFGSALLDYAEASGDWDTARELWPVAKWQVQYLQRYLNREGLFEDPGGWWIFFDWDRTLDKQAPMHGLLGYAMRACLRLAGRLGAEKEVAEYPKALARMEQAARERLFDRSAGLFTSGGARQVSYTSQVWMRLGGFMRPEEFRAAPAALQSRAGALMPKTPYLWHHVVEAMLASGMESEAFALIDSYWGGMVRAGADTFWEVYDPKDPHLSPYKSYLVNSYCHAWSCTPSYFIRRRYARA